MSDRVAEQEPAQEHVRIEREGAVAVLRLDRPPMNALDSGTSRQLGAAAARLAADRDVRAVVVYGGPRLFAAGADISEMAGWSYPDAVAGIAPLQAAVTAVARLPQPVVAAVTGYALGGGLELALACDFRVLSANARVGQPEILLGVIPGAGGTQRLARLVGPARAKDLVFSGRHVRAEEALALGIADEVVPAEEVYDAALARARALADGPTVAIAAAKRAIDEGLGLGLDDGLRLEATLFAALFGSDDQRAGMTSFLEHGPGRATFSGA